MKDFEKNIGKQGKSQDKGGPIEVRTLVELVHEKNTSNDCGPLSLMMLLRTDRGDGELQTLEKLRERVGKVDFEGTMPGDLVRALAECGYTPTYHTGIDWQACTTDPDTDFANWDMHIQSLPEDLFREKEGVAFINLKKMRSSAEWLVTHTEFVSTTPITLVKISQYLAIGRRVIALVGGNHYVVVTGIDGTHVFINNPDTQSEEVYTHKEFKDWQLAGLGTEEVIVIGKSNEEISNDEQNTK